MYCQREQQAGDTEECEVCQVEAGYRSRKSTLAPDQAPLRNSSVVYATRTTDGMRLTTVKYRPMADPVGRN